MRKESERNMEIGHTVASLLPSLPPYLHHPQATDRITQPRLTLLRVEQPHERVSDGEETTLF